MRNLCFKVNAQMIESVGDISGLVPGTEGYLIASFEFSNEWDGCVKAASFFDRKGKEYAERIVNNRCLIPKEVLTERFFKLRVQGIKQNYRILSNTIKIKQEG